MADDDDDTSSTWTWSMTDQPFSYVIFPLLFLFVGGFIAVMLFNRRRRRRLAAMNPSQWPHDRTTAHVGQGSPRHLGRGSQNRRWAPWGGTRSQEGLNELGEAPPPYDGKRDGHAQEAELRDLESGTANPPGYPAEPGPAVTRDQQRWA